MQCICNLMRTTLDSLEVRDRVIAMMEAYSLAEIIGINIWRNVDNELNLHLLEAGWAIIDQAELARGFLMELAQSGGISGLSALIEQSENQELTEKAEVLLERYHSIMDE